jgi:biopolymer transport protein ExbD
MGLKRRNRTSAEFSMASLTDIIFLLLIFFMLTATFVQIQNVELPQSDSKTVASTSIAVTLDKTGAYYVNGEEVPGASLERLIRDAVTKSDNRENATVTIVAEVGVPFDRVAKVMGIASDLRVKAILATQPRKG